jgi:hypothetical protein
MLSGHYTPALLAKDLELLNHRPTIHIHHIKPGCETTVIEQCHAALPSHTLNIVQREQLIDI